MTFEDRDGFIWFNGDMVPWREAKLHVLSHGLHYASAVFEGERAYNGNVFRLTDHSNRLKTSAEILGFELPYSVDEINDATNKVLEANDVKNGYIRPIAWRGPANMSISTPVQDITVAIGAWAWDHYYGDDKLTGIKLKSSKWHRPKPNTAPTDSKCASLYVIGTMAKNEAEADGYDDALMFTHNDYVAETSGANIFFVKNDELYTPKPEGFLNGLTRQSIISLARKNGIKVHVRRIHKDELSEMDECFITGTAVEITAINEIQHINYSIVYNVPGKITSLLYYSFHDLVQKTENEANMILRRGSRLTNYV